MGLAVVLRLAFYPILGDRYPFFLFFVAIVLAAGYGGYGPSLLALTLSWLSVDYLFLVPRASPNIFESKSQLAFAFFPSGWPSPCSAGPCEQPVNVPRPAA